MSVAIDLQVRDAVTPVLIRVEAKLANRTALHQALGETGATLVRDHFGRREAGGNKYGWPKTHFFAQAAKGTQYRANATSAVIVVNKQGIRQRLLGGTIVPRNKTYLTLPANAESYGKTAREFNDLKFAIVTDPDTGKKRAALVQTALTQLRFGRKRKDGTRKTSGEERPGGKVMFWLAKKVHQNPDPDVLPTHAQMQTALEATAARFLSRNGGNP